MKRPDTIDPERVKQALLDFLRQHWKIFFLEGLVFVTFGTLAVVVPHVSTIGITLFLGWILLLGGIIQIVRAVGFISMPGFGLWLMIGAVQTAFGYFLVTEPIRGSLTLTFLLTLFFAVEGIGKMGLALMMRPLAHWGSMLFSGITALSLAVVVWLGWPHTGVWVLGLMVGINMMILGWVLIRLSLHHKTVD